MKKIFLFICIIFSLSLYSQRTGISYQALILDPNGEQLPGYNNENSPLTNTAICLEFIIRDDRNVIEYSEYQSVTTDKYGMVNLIIGTGDYAGGYSGGWSSIVWNEEAKKLVVKLDTSATCSDFIEISNQELTSVAFALYAPGQEGRDGESAYEIWLSEGNVGSVQQFLESLKGEKGDDGLSAFEVWVDLGNSETEQDFLDSLKGDDGKSAYQIWLDAGNTGTEQEFLDSLKGSSGADGTTGNQSLIKTTVEAAGDNCINGGIKIETGIDANEDGILDNEEINTSQTKYLCNGTDGTDGTGGNGSGEIVPHSVKLVKWNEDYTIPSGYVAEISGMPTQYEQPQQPQILINGDEYILGYQLTGASQTSENAYSNVSGGIWLDEGDIVTADAFILYISIKLYSKSLFTPKLITSSSTVPNGKMWKITSFLMKKRNDWTNTGGSANFPTAFFKSLINDEKVILGWIHPSNYLSSLSKEIWLPAETSLAPDDNIAALTVLEYSTGSSTGTGSNSSGSSTNSTSSNTLIYTTQGF